MDSRIGIWVEILRVIHKSIIVYCLENPPAKLIITINQKLTALNERAC